MIVEANSKDSSLEEKRATGKKQRKLHADQMRQNSDYSDYKAKPDNNIFFEGRSNPLSSKGN